MPITPPPPDTRFAKHWRLRTDVAQLNHGSFGATPVSVLEKQAELRERMERDLVRFFVRDLEGLLDAARAGLAAFVGADADDVVFVRNITQGVNAVLRSLRFEPGDRLLTTDQEYNACANALRFVAERWGASVDVAHIPFPIASEDDAVERVLGAVTPRTRLALIDHVVSQTGLVLPIERIVRELAERGVDTLVDGAHAPGMIPLDISAIGAAYYTANCHKWICAPKGAGFLHVRRDRQSMVRPTSISHGANSPRTDRSRFLVEFGWTGTDDPTAALCVPEALRFMASLLPGGWPAVMASNRAKAVAAREVLCAALGIERPCPDGMVGSLAAFPIADGSGEPSDNPLYLDPLQDALLERGIEVPVIPWPAPPKRLMRISAQVYNEAGQYAALASALVEMGVRPAAAADVH